ncbi:MAG: prepilin-type N-terminal cleavage/methylation domain-containing protein [Gammaproteobacteria bacterium]
MPSGLDRGGGHCVASIAGFSLLENMIAVAILSIGLLGSARLFGEALRELHSNSNRRIAVVLADELVNRFLATRDNLVFTGSPACTLAVEACFDDSSIEAWVSDWRRRLGNRLTDARAILSVSHSDAVDAWLLEISWIGRHGRSESQRFEIVWRR